MQCRAMADVRLFSRITEPGGYVQWVERDWLSKFPKTISSTDSANAQVTAYLSTKFFPQAEYVLSCTNFAYSNHCSLLSVFLGYCVNIVASVITNH